MSTETPTDPDGLPALIAELESLLRNPDALSRHAIYGEPYQRAVAEADKWFAEQQSPFRQIERRGQAIVSGRSIHLAQAARLERASMIAQGLLLSRQAVLRRLAEVRRQNESGQSPEARIARIKAELARLENSKTAQWLDDEYGPFGRSLIAGFSSLMKQAEDEAARVDGHGEEGHEQITRAKGKAAQELDYQFRQPVMAQFARERHERIEALRVELHEAEQARNQLQAAHDPPPGHWRTRPFDPTCGEFEVVPTRLIAAVRRHVPDFDGSEPATVSSLLLHWRVCSRSDLTRLTIGEIYQLVATRLTVEPPYATVSTSNYLVTPTRSARPAATNAGVSARAQGEPEPKTRMSASDIARSLNADPETISKRLERWRRNHDAGWQQVPNRNRREPQYLYEWGAVREVVIDLRNTV